MSISYPVNIKTGEIENGAVTAEKLATASVTEPKIATNAVSAAKIGLPLALPAKAANGEITQPTGAFPPTSVLSTWTGNAATTKFKIKHSGATFAISWAVYKAAAEKPAELIAEGAGAEETKYKMTFVNENEIEITHGAAPAAGNQYFIFIFR